MRFLNRQDTLRALPMVDAVDAMEEAFRALHLGKTEIPIRSHLEHDGFTFLAMPGIVRDPTLVGAKLISVVPKNADAGRPVIQGVIVLFDPNSGGVRGILDGQSLTALRTGAVSGLATRWCSRKESRILAMIGSGPQADTQIEAVCAVRPISKVAIYSRTRENARALRDRLVARPFIGSIDVSVCKTAAEATREADIVCTATRATAPVLHAADITEGTHINAVGSYTLGMRELDVDLVTRATVVVDDVEASLSEAGELVDAIELGRLNQSDMLTLGGIVNGDVKGRVTPADITIFKSVGLAVQDLTAAGRALDRAEERQLGTLL